MTKIDFPYNKDLLILNNIFNINDADNLRIVGGAVRNFLLNKKISDFDLSCIFSPEKVAQILENNKIKYIPTGIKFGTITAIVQGKPYEITSTREDIQTDGRHAVVKYTNDFKIDAERRDFTFNALYLDFNNNIYDYFNGIDDLKKGIVRFIGSAESRINEDYLRILRFFRFYCYYGTVLDNEGLRFSIALKDKLALLSSERIKTEMFKILNANYPIQTLEIMEKNGILQLISGLSKFNFEKLEILYSLKSYLNIEISPVLVLSLMLNKIEDLNILNDKWKLSKKEFNEILYLVKHKNDKIYNEKEIKKILFLDNNKDFLYHLIVVNSVMNNQNIKDINLNLDFVKQLNLPKLPINGNDLEVSGFLNKVEYRNIINKANEIFIESNFSLNKNKILSKLISN
ncbi:MAG: CCA tRNA nucleotidyltransferase [Rickettsiales bacterium]|nr:CCA tRNA nucleotidyltransferase [Rickettsiales bacterium]